MIMSSTAFNGAIEGGNRNYKVLASVALSSGQTLTINNTAIWSSGFSLDDSICTTSDALEIGTAIVNKATLVISNLNEAYSTYDFEGAVVTIQVGLKPSASDPVAYINKGTFTVEKASYNTSLITLECVDNMAKFDKNYTSNLTFPSTALQVVQEACTACGVTLGVQSFSGDSTAVIAPPESAVTYRNMLSWVGQLCGLNWRIDNAGELQPVWYNMSALEQFYDGGTFSYTDGANLDGGTFAYTDGDSADGGAFDWSGYFLVIHAASADVAVDDTIVTGVKIQVTGDEVTTYTAGTDGYSIVIEDNPLITTDNAQTIANALATRLVGLRYRKGTISHMSDPRMEPGDAFIYADHKGHDFPMIVSQVLFTVGEYQTTISASETPARNSADRYSKATQNEVKALSAVSREQTARENAVQALAQALADSPGLYQSTESDGAGGTIYYLHDRPQKADSDIVWKMTAEAFAVSTDGGTTWNAGLTAAGNAVLNRIYAIGIDAQYINASTLSVISGNLGSVTVGGTNNSNGVIAVKDSSGTQAGTWNNLGLTIAGDDITTTMGVDGKLSFVVSNPSAVSSGTIYTEDTNGRSLYIAPWGITLNEDDTNYFDSSSLGTHTLLLMNSEDVITVTVSASDGAASFAYGGFQADYAMLKVIPGTGVTTYNVLEYVNYTDDIRLNSAGGDLYLGYANTTGIDFLNGKAEIDTNGYLTVSRVYTGNAESNSNGTLIGAGSVEIFHATPYIDFHYGNSSADYTSRIIERASGTLTVYNNLYVNQDMSAATVTQRSDERLKDIGEYDSRYDDLLDQLTPITFTWKDDESKCEHVGLGAQTVQKALTDLGLDDSGFVRSDSDGILSINYMALSVMLLHTVQALKKRVDVLERGDKNA